jgi:hypothetical protein
MQRPDSKILDGKLKNNLTVRMGFKCADLINSRVIGTPGSEKLTIEGYMLLKLPVYSKPIEIQAPYLGVDRTKKVMKEKINRYESYYLSNKWRSEPWQPHSREVFPAVIVMTETRYQIESSHIKFFQVQHIDQLMNLFKPKQEPIEIKIN